MPNIQTIEYKEFIQKIKEKARLELNIKDKNR